MAMLADTDTVDTSGMGHLGELGTNSVSHVVLGNRAWGDVAVASSKGLSTASHESGTRHGHALELVLLAGASVGENKASTAVFILLAESDVDGLLGLTECGSAVEDSLLICGLGDGSFGALRGVNTKRNSRALEELRHAL